MEPVKSSYQRLIHHFGSAEVILGLLSISLSVITLIVAVFNPDTSEFYPHKYTFSSQGLWCGVLLCVTGALGMKTKDRMSRRDLNQNLTMSIMTALATAALVFISFIATGVYYDSGWYQNQRHTCLIVIHGVIAIFGLIAGILCILHTAYACIAIRHKPCLGEVTLLAAEIYVVKDEITKPATKPRNSVLQTECDFEGIAGDNLADYETLDSLSKHSLL